ncbi:acyltransferase domain-containing protein, partial [Streptomyces sp. NPDC017524]|uniref:acyltransferase domain-containing protein n=1 Tax=Streptomyces sp. NPDC017524 TaxID=3364999 RepID=UPI00379257F1
LQDACRLVAARGRLMQALPAGGAMVALQATEEETVTCLAERELGGRVQVAAVNGPRAVVVSGDQEAVDEVAALFEARDRRVRRLRVSHAFHSHRMEPMLAEFGKTAATLTYHPPTIPVISNVTGRTATTDELTSPDYWVRQVRGTVRFHDGIRTLTDAQVTTFAEIGPRGVLTAMVTDCLPENTPDPAACVALTRTGRPEPHTLLNALAHLWTTGTHLDWHTLLATTTNTNDTGGNGSDDGDSGSVELPTYAFDRRPYWLERIQYTPGDPLEDRFWAAIDRQDAGELAALMDIEAPETRSSLGSVLPALAEWRQQWSGENEFESWRYRIEWDLLPVAADAPSLTGNWLVLAPRSAAHAETASACVGALTEHGAKARLVEVDSAVGGRDALAAALDGYTDDSLAGIVSLLALDETPHPDHPAVPTGLATT